MNSIRIRDVLIQDIDHNNLYDPTVDLVTDLKGQALTLQETSEKMNSILAELKAPQWKGLSLSRLSLYLECMRGAKNSAFLGEVQETHNSLSDAEVEAKLLSLPFDPHQAFSLEHQALKNSMNSHIRRAEKASRIGDNVDEVKSVLAKARNEADELNRTFKDPVVFDLNRADLVLKTAYSNQINRLYGDSQRQAKDGKIGMVRYCFMEIKFLMREANQKWNLQMQFNQALADHVLKEAFIYGIPREYKEAEALATQGQTRQVRNFLVKIQSHIREANQSFNLGLSYDKKRADDIMADALTYGVSDNFNLARGYAKKRNVFLASRWLTTAHQYIKEYNQKYASPLGRKPLVFDQDRADAILRCARGQSLCP